MLLLFLFEGAVFVQKWPILRPDLLLFFSFKQVTFAGFLRFQLLTLLISFLHESAHGLTCKHYGGQVRKMGLMLIYYMPAAFIDNRVMGASAQTIADCRYLSRVVGSFSAVEEYSY